MLLEDAKRLSKRMKSGDIGILSTEDIEMLMEQNRDLYEVSVQRANSQGYLETVMLLPRAMTQEALLSSLKKAGRL